MAHTAIQSYKMLLDGEWVDAESRATYSVKNPANGEIVANVPKGGPEDAKKAVDAAREAFKKGRWPRMSPGERANVLLKAATLIEQDIDRLAILETLQQGKPSS